MSDVFTLHGSPHSQFTYKVALMLNLSRQPFCFRYVSFQKGVHLTPEFRELSRWSNPAPSSNILLRRSGSLAPTIT